MVIRKIFEIFLLIVITEGCCFATEYPEIKEIQVNLGDNITLPCYDDEDDNSARGPASLDLFEVMWVREGRAEKQISRLHILTDGSLLLTDIDRTDGGVYACSLEEHKASALEEETVALDDANEIVKARFKISVRTPPGPLVNVTVRPSTILALLLWEVEDTGGCEITHFTAQYRLRHVERPDEWHYVIPKRISPTVRHIDIYHLIPNSTYTFQIWANNKLGEGEITQLEGTTLHDPIEIELARHLLEGAENFDTRVWVAAVAVVMGTLIMLAAGTCYLLYKECNVPSFSAEDQEIIELVPNIILNPGFYDTDLQTERIYEPDENSNDQTPVRFNNNTVIRPIRV